MNTKLKKILIIVIIILIIALIGLLVYKFVLKKPSEEGKPSKLPPSKEGEEITPSKKEITPEIELKIKAISQEPVLSPTLTADKTKVIYYLVSNGNVWQSDFNGSNLSQVSDAVLDNLIQIFWSPDKNKVVSVFQDKLEKVIKYIYNYETKKTLNLNQYINSVTWSSDGKKIAYQYQNENTNQNEIGVSNFDGSGYATILKTRLKDLIIDWPKGSELFLREKPSGLVPSSLYSLNALTKVFVKVIPDVYGLSIEWSPTGDKILYSSTNNKGTEITIFTADRSGSNQKSIGVSTLAEKCVWSQDPRIIFCAIPLNIKNAGILPDNFYKGTFLADDEFYKINLETGEKDKILEDKDMWEEYDAFDLFLSPEENYLFFVNKVNGLLYSIKLE